MRTITKKVFYCDFCKKHSLRSDCTKSHEEHCTLNPDRQCGLCDNQDLGIAFDIEEIKETDLWTSRKILITGDECPCCVLSFVRRNKIDTVKKIKDEKSFWDYKEESKRYLDQKIKEQNPYY
jgi:hypothetical protein